MGYWEKIRRDNHAARAAPRRRFRSRLWIALAALGALTWWLVWGAALWRHASALLAGRQAAVASSPLSSVSSSTSAGKTP